MNRLAATLALDVRLQFRNGFYYAGLFVILFLAAILYFLVPQEYMGFAIPVFLVASLQGTTFYFIAGLILLEKGEGTLEGIVVTPLRPTEYLTSKLSTLTLLALLENVAVIGLVYGFQARWGWLVCGIVLMSLQYILAGIIMATRYDSLTDFLFPSIVCILFLELPLLHYFHIWPVSIFYLCPLQAPLLLLRDGFEPISVPDRVYAVIYSALWTAIGFRWAEERFKRFVIRKEGSDG